MKSIITPTRKARAFARFAAAHPHIKDGPKLNDAFYDQACFALGICNHSSWVRMDVNDKRWDKVAIDPA